MNKYLRSILLALSLLFTQVFVAQKLYWVGGSGNFNDPAHWSQQSGGVGGAKTPTATDDVYFDENSFLNKSIINFIGATEVHDFIFTEYTSAVIFSGLQNEKITINGNVQLNSYIDNQFAGDIWFTSNAASTSVIFELTKFKGNIYFNGNTNWQIKGDLVTDDNASVYFKKGVYNLNNGIFYTGNLIAEPKVTINASEIKFTVKNKFVLPAGVTFNDSKSIIYAHIKDATKFQISPTINFHPTSRLYSINSVMSACSITLVSQTQPTCLGSCNGKLFFNIPASCSSSSNPIYAIWSSGSGCTHIPTAVITPGSTYSVGGLCGCTQRYTPLFTNDTLSQDSSYSPSTAGGIAIGDPSPPTIQSLNATLFPPSCFGLCDGKILLTVGVNSGTTPLSAIWTPPTGTVVTHNGIKNTSPNNKDTLKNVCAGTYSVQLADANGCPSATSTITMAQPALVTHTITPTNVLCFGVCNGSIVENLSGGTSPFTYTWSASAAGTTTNTANSSTYAGLCAGTYTVKTKDAHGCKDSATATIAQPTDITFIKNPTSGTYNVPCISACTGIVGVTSVAGGTGAYSYSWSPAGGSVSPPGSNSSIYSGLCGSVAGITYTCTIEDANSCKKTATYTVIAPAALSHTIAATNPKCNAGSTGSATVTESGGLAPYTFTWTPAGTVSGVSPKSINSNIPSGTYTVMITDFNGCADTAKVVLTPPPVLTSTITTTTNPTCPNLNNGQLCVTAGGGTPSFTYSWTPASAGTASCTPSTLVSGAYSVTVTDANSCTVTTSATLVPPPSITVTAAVTQPSCAGLSNGSATLTATGGNGVFSYQWSCSAVTTSTIGGMAAGVTCNYTVTDGNNCKQTGSVVFTSVSPVTLSLTSTTLACSGNCNAQISSSVGGGTPGYTYAWTGTGLNPVCAACPNQTNMCAGTYTCIVTDAHGCTKTANTSIAAPTPIVVSFTPTNPTCNGLCNGSILAVPSGGTGAPYASTAWSPSPLPAPNAATTLHPINLCANTYSLQVVDNNGCTVTDTVSLIDPVPITISLTTTSITCAGQNNGTASVTPSGGTPAYQYSWDNGAFGAISSQSNLASGTHTITVKDSKGCFAITQVFTINQPTNLTATATNVVNTCNGLCNGGATANVTGGTPGYQYSWDNAAGPFSAGATSVSSLCAGTHTLFVQDANGCLASATFTVTPVINISISSSSTSVSCHNLCDATATAIASGSANPPYTIQWAGSNTCNNVAASSPCIGVNLCGTVTVTATDVNGCSNTTTLSIANPPALTATTNTTSVECFGLCTGTATVTPSGGTPAASAPLYSISWSPGPLPNGTTQSNLCPGTYTASIVDNNGCVLSQPVTIGVSNQFTVTPTITHPSSCGFSDASIALAISGGSGTYTVNWNTGSTANPLTGIPAGTYTATIKDGNSCDTTLVYAVNDLTGPTTTVTVDNNVVCFGQSDGVATVSGSGSAPITVAWPVGNPTGLSPQIGTHLSAGNTLVQVTDAFNCLTTATVTIVSPTIIKDNSTTIQPICNGSLGSITLNPSGGNGAPYSFNWNGTGFVIGNNSLTGLSAGTYSCVIRDVAGCTSQTYTYIINPTNTLSLSISATSVTCSYSKNGTATASMSGGLPAYTYTWTNSLNGIIAQGTNISNVSGLAPDTYTLSVNDANNCNTQATFTISAPAVINSNFVKNNNLCSSGSTGAATVTPTGGTAPYSYLWNTINPPPVTSTVSAVIPGSYHVIVYDANFCSDTTNFTITAPTSLTMAVAFTDPTCFGLANGSATITSVAGGTPYTASGTAPYTLSWGGVICPTCSVVTNLSSGITYTAIASDSNGCTISQSIILTSPTQIVPTFTINPPTCVGYSNGSILSSTTGGTGAYTYQWLPVGTAGNATSAINLSAGVYTLTITDANSCTSTTVIPLNDPNALSLIYSSTPATCNQPNGSIIINSANGTGTVSVLWVNPASCASSYTCNALPAGIYSIKLTDSNNCTDTLLATVTNTGGPTITTTTTDINCYGTCNGAAAIKVTSGAVPFTFTWNSPPTAALVVSTDSASTASGLCDSTYISIVTDALGCKTITSFKINEPIQIKDNPNITSATCFGINDGSITSTGSGGTAFTNGYIYSIDGGGIFGPSASHAFSNLAAGTHTVSITDSVSCTRTFTYTITPASIIQSNISATNATCNGNCNGTATVLNITGGTTPINIIWNDPASQVGNFATNLCAGSYTATLTDASGCMALDTINIVAPSTITPNTVVTNPACGQCDGNITVTPSGGNGAVYTFTWTSPPSHAPTINNICAGPYQVNIADNLGCTQTFQIPVSNSSAPTFTLASTNVVCNTMCNGSATVTTIAGGIAPYTYSWPNVTPVSTSSVASALCADTTSPYFVQVKDNAGCIATQSFVITAPSTFTVDNTNTSPSCAVCNGVITLTVTGASTYTYSWSNGATTSSVTALCAGIYSVVVTDNVSGCNITKVIALNNNSGPTLNVMSTPATCFDSCNGSATVTASFGTAPYSYTWSPSGGNGTVATNLCDSTYFILVTDGAGCVQTSQVNISSPTALIASLPTVLPIKCANDCNGAITTVIFGGTPSYTYVWSPSTISGTGGTNLCAGNYSLMVTDANGCSVQEFDTLVNPTPLVTTGTVTPSSCNNTADGAITTITTGGTLNYTYQWSGGSSAQTQNLTNTLAGTYTLVAADANNCTDTTNYTLSAAVTVIANAGRDTTLCSDSPVILTGTVTGAASFDWQDITGAPIPPANTLTLSVNPATPTQYVLAAVNGLCSDNDTVSVNISALSVANAGASQSVFFGQTAIIGGSPPNPAGGTITWMPNIALSDTAASNPTASPTVTTTYTLTVTNALGCAVTDTMIVTILPPFNINNGFTPNGDGKNDAWVIDELYKFPNTEIEIYNRWGEQLFYSKGAYTPWNGTYKGSPVPVGTYYYIIRLNDKNYPDHYAGPLTILR